MFVHSQKPGSQYVRVELSSRDIRRWRDGDADVTKEAEREALIHGLKWNLPEYLIVGANDVPLLAHGYIDALKKRYPDVTEDSIF